MLELRKRTYNLMRWSEKYTKTDMVYLTKGGFWISLAQFINSILSLALIVAFANLLPKETYGTYKYILSLASILNIFTLTGMNRSVSRAVATGKEESFLTAIKYQLKWHTLMFLAFWFLAGYYFVNQNNILAISLLILGLLIPLSTTLNTYNAYLSGKKEFRLSSTFSILSTSIYILGMIITLYLNGGVIWLIFSFGLTTFISNLIFYLVTYKKFNLSTKNNDQNPEETLKYGRQLTFIGFIGPIASQIDKIVLSHFWGASQLAIYALAMAIPERLVSYIKNWVAIGFPKFASKSLKEVNSVFYLRIFQGILVGLLIALFYILLAPFIFRYLLPQYTEGIFYSQILAISFIFAMPNRYISLLCESQKLTKLIFWRTTTHSILAIVLFLIMGILGGVWGLVIASVLNSFTGMAINIFMWKWASKKLLGSL